MFIKYNISGNKYAKKPTGAQMGTLRTQLCAKPAIVETTPERLIEAIEEGRAFTPGVMEGTSGETWKQQQIIAVDIDNAEEVKDADGNPVKENGKTKKKAIEPQLLPEEALEILQAEGLAPYFMYNTYSNRDEWRRYRIVFILDEVLLVPKAPGILQARLVSLFNAKHPGSTDTGTIDAARIFLGSTPGAVFYRGGNITNAGTLWQLPESYTEKEEKKRETEKKERAERLANMGDDFADQEQRFKDAKAAFDLAAFVAERTGSKPKKKGNYITFNPCPICGHNDDFKIDLRKGTGFYRCLSASEGGGTYGSVVDYLINAEHMTQAEAIQYAKYKLLGFDEKEDKRRFAEAMEEKERAEITQKRKAAGQAATDPAGDPRKQETTPAAATNAQEKKKTYNDILADFWATIQTEEYRPVRTGVDGIDKALDGGFTRKTLVTLGAAPGMGKTALAQWIFEGMARNGSDVLYINLEMSREQLIARSLSRMVYNDTGEDVSALSILRGYKWTEEQRETVGNAWKKYREEVAPHFIYNPNTTNHIGLMTDGAEDPTGAGILPTLRRVAEASKKAGKEAPIVCVDYLQIIETSQRDQIEGIKQVISALKGFAIQYNTIVFLVLANNRASNKEGRSDMESSRDTSAIEYSGDVMLGLTYTAIEDGYKAYIDEIDDKLKVCNPREKEALKDLHIPMKKSQKGDPKPEWEACNLDHLRELKKQAYDDEEELPEVCRKVSLKIVKNRFGSPERRLHLDFDGKHSSFIEDDGIIGRVVSAKDLPFNSETVKTEFKGRNFKTGAPTFGRKTRKE